MSAPSPTLEVDSQRIAGRFEVLGLLGDGSFATVYEAIDRNLDRRVALKLFTGYAENEIELALREARAMAKLDHVNVLIVHDVGEHEGTPFLALEFAHTDLRRWLTKERPHPDLILARFIEAGRGLAEAHRAGLVHHDFKPANVMIRANGCAAVGDFGLARYLDSTDDRGGRGIRRQAGSSSYCSHAFGTLRYIAPERLLGELGDTRSDQFSFCVALWEALADAGPFEGADAESRYASITAGPRGTPRAPAHVQRALRRGLSPVPSDRYASMDALLDAIRPRPARRELLRRGLGGLSTAAVLTSVFVLGFGLSREAPALDIGEPPEVLTIRSAVAHARELGEAEPRLAVDTVTSIMPTLAKVDPAVQRDLVPRIEALGDDLDAAGAYVEAHRAYVLALALAKRAGLPSADTGRLKAKHSTSQARARRIRLAK
ncbi:serine/threonine protein kinase [Pseudenhygromyxa sp. WMMC2535]|uniref:serine/threonine-protein kinase n=1 Tax=Pseudenhygromyxa sp. WMMC2535 TaxID=2712867 RepID=UPI00155358F5|nr:serine/threonine-protein kinase [Pseudenhygromyxa sp. WMMC2535]NVB41283.1 serine/threonine protein kinase [Pseudenhygromyxa sp. WMMC2535]